MVNGWQKNEDNHEIKRSSDFLFDYILIEYQKQVLKTKLKFRRAETFNLSWKELIFLTFNGQFKF